VEGLRTGFLAEHLTETETTRDIGNSSIFQEVCVSACEKRRRQYRSSYEAVLSILVVNLSIPTISNLQKPIDISDCGSL